MISLNILIQKAPHHVSSGDAQRVNSTAVVSLS